MSSPCTWQEYSAAFCKLTLGRFLAVAIVFGDMTVDEYDAVGTVDVVVHDDELVGTPDVDGLEFEFEFSNSNCCTCNISTYSSKLFCADSGFGRLSETQNFTDSCTKLLSIGIEVELEGLSEFQQRQKLKMDFLV